MNINKLAQESLDFLKSEYGLPESGFIAGGSLSNLMWEKISGNKAVINDIDVYKFQKSISLNESEVREKQHYADKEAYLYDDYSGVHSGYRTKEFYVIDHVERDGILNTIYYDSGNPCPETILKSFDINCCQVGYDIDTGKFHWTHQFEDFLNNKKLQIVNLGSPAHTAIRLVKKSHELNCNFDEVDLDMIEWCIESKRFLDSGKLRFKDRYAEMYKVYESDLNTRFVLERDSDLENWLNNSKNITDRIWQLKKKNEVNIFSDDLNIGSIFRSVDFVFYIRNIFGNKELEKIWFNLHHLFNPDCRMVEYLDIDPSAKDLELLNNLTKSSSGCVNNLKGLSLSNQLKIVRSLLSRYSDDPIVAISILEKHKLSDVELEDDFGMLLLELSVRREIIEDTKGKVNKLFETTHTDH